MWLTQTGGKEIIQIPRTCPDTIRHLDPYLLSTSEANISRYW